ncbi:MAG: DNA polymerase sliding clamp [Thermoproteota archaeon]
MARAKLSFPDAKSFYNIMEALGKIVDEASVSITPESFKVVALDPAHVVLIRIEIPNEAFIEYDVEEDGAKMGFNVETVSKILKRGKKGDKVEIEVEDDRVTWSIISATVKRFRVLNVEVPQPEVPEAELDFNVKVSLIVDPFKNALKDVEAVSDTVELEAPAEDLLIVRGVGPAVAEAKISADSPAVVEFSVKEPSKAAYSLDYLKNVISLTKVADTITLEFSQDMPLRLVFQLPVGGTVTYMQAPKAS